jgi:hypothetical protein
VADPSEKESLADPAGRRVTDGLALAEDTPVTVLGRISARRWSSPSGNKIFSEVVANHVSVRAEALGPSALPAPRNLSTRMRHLGHESSEEHLLPGRSNSSLRAERAA